MSERLQPNVLWRYDSGLELRVVSPMPPLERGDVVCIPKVIYVDKRRPHIRILGAGLFVLTAHNSCAVPANGGIHFESWGVNWAGMDRLDREDYRMVFADNTIVNPLAGIVWVGATFEGHLQITVPQSWRPTRSGLRE